MTSWNRPTHEESEDARVLIAYEHAYDLGIHHAKEIEASLEDEDEKRDDPLSGEYADDWTPATLVRAVGLSTRDALVQSLGLTEYEHAELESIVCDAFEQGYASTLKERVLYRVYTNLRSKREDTIARERMAREYSAGPPCLIGRSHYQGRDDTLMDAMLAVYREAGTPRYWC